LSSTNNEQNTNTNNKGAANIFKDLFYNVFGTALLTPLVVLISGCYHHYNAISFVITPSIACHFQSISFFLSYTERPSIHIRLNTPAVLHSWNLSCTVLEAPGHEHHIWLRNIWASPYIPSSSQNSLYIPVLDQSEDLTRLLLLPENCLLKTV